MSVAWWCKATDDVCKHIQVPETSFSWYSGLSHKRSIVQPHNVEPWDNIFNMIQIFPVVSLLRPGGGVQPLLPLRTSRVSWIRVNIQTRNVWCIQRTRSTIGPELTIPDMESRRATRKWFFILVVNWCAGWNGNAFNCLDLFLEIIKTGWRANISATPKELLDHFISSLVNIAWWMRG